MPPGLLRLVFPRGTPVWGFNRFRTDALVAFIDDLARIEDVGLGEVRGREARAALATIVARVAKAPEDSWLRGSLSRPLRDIEYLFVDWNSFDGPDAPDSRRRFVKSMRQRRDKIASRVRGKERILAKEVDLELVDDIYSAFEKLANGLPEIFRDLKRACERYRTARSKS